MPPRISDTTRMALPLLNRRVKWIPEGLFVLVRVGDQDADFEGPWDGRYAEYVDDADVLISDGRPFTLKVVKLRTKGDYPVITASDGVEFEVRPWKP